LQVRLAGCAADIDAAQALRYRSFTNGSAHGHSPAWNSSAATATPSTRSCDHLLVLDHSRGSGLDAVVGTYRLIRARGGGAPRQLLLGRRVRHLAADRLSGRDPRTRPLLCRCRLPRAAGHAIAVERHRRLCLSLRHCGDVRLRQPARHRPDALAVPLSYLYHHHLAPPALRARALPERYVDMRRLEPGAIDPARTLAALPPLIKGYLRLGGFVGDGAVIDEQFNTTDVCIVVKTDLVTEKYSRHYERQTKETWAA